MARNADRGDAVAVKRPSTPVAPQALQRDGLQSAHTRTGLSSEILAHAILDNLSFVLGRHIDLATPNEWYRAVAYTVRDRLMDRWIRNVPALIDKDVKTVAYLSAEFLMGPQLQNHLVALGAVDAFREAVKSLGRDLDDIISQEEEPGLGNGGLGRLAACYLDSLATLRVPAFGYGIRYEFGIFDQEIRDGWQLEITDKWLRRGNPWEIARYEIAFPVNFGGRTEHVRDAAGRTRVRWIPERVVKGVAYDTPVLGYGVEHVDILRLWKSESFDVFDVQAFNQGDYYGAVEREIQSENLTKVLYPNDERLEGKQLRLEQQYFFVSCSLRDMIRLHLLKSPSVETFDRKWAVQLNDTHPSIAVAELMRLLLDEYDLDWDKAWGITTRTMAYTNHTLLPEALERWPLPLFARVLPRPLEIIYEINRRFLDDVRLRHAGDEDLIRRVSLIDDSGEKYVRMANLATVGSHAVNGVAALHSELLKTSVLSDFHRLMPEKFSNVTNGVTPRRWIAVANPGLTSLLRERIGDTWLSHTEEQLPRLEPLAEDAGFRDQWRKVKRENKERLARILREQTGVVADPDSLFDIQVKRIHEYKRQHLSALHVIAEYARLKQNPGLDVPPRTIVFAGKAAPGYRMAKLIIKLITSVADVVNRDPALRDRMKVVFMPDFNVKNAQPVYPAADLSEQISTAGKEASGTGNMKFSLNGALTIGTLDGANVEIMEAVGKENFFLFGLTVEEVAETWARGYSPRAALEADPALREAIELIQHGHFSMGDPELFRPLTDSLLNRDEYLVFKDFPAYTEAQSRVSKAFQDQDRWTRMSILNVARMGFFSSDRSVREYCDRIWKAAPAPM
ncbi:MAG TPA: glycogen/starch/alpha-glucan phosphorylase [Planctomycetota bacterium]|nr:glycogen/starch/alpha-glucan phosphorylase [Planctomycetota bacterium]